MSQARVSLVIHGDGAKTQSDRELLGATRAGEAAAYGVFFERYQAVVMAYLLRRTRQRDAAADLAGEVFARALMAVHAGRGPSKTRQRHGC